MAKLPIEVDSTDVKRAAAELKALTQAAQKAAREAEKFAKQQTQALQAQAREARNAANAEVKARKQVETAAKSQAQAATRAASERVRAERMAERAMASTITQYRNLKSAIDPAHAAQVRYDAAMRTTNDAYRMGVIGAAEYQRTVAQITSSLGAAEEANNLMSLSTLRLSNMTRIGRGNIQQFGYQIQDVAVQLQAGQNPLIILSQQGSQIASLFGAGGAMFGSVLAIGAAIGTFLLPSLFETETAAERAKKATDAFADAVKNVTSATDNAVQTNTEMFMMYGQYADNMDRLYDVLLKISKTEADAKLRAVGVQFKEAFSMEGILSNREMANLFELPNFTFAAGAEGRANKKDTRSKLGAIQSGYENVMTEQDPQKRLEAAQALFDAYNEAAMASGTINTQEAEHLGLLSQMVLQMTELATQAEREADAQRTAAAIAAGRLGAGMGRGGNPADFGDPFAAGDPSGARAQIEEQITARKKEQTAELLKQYSIYASSRTISNAQTEAAKTAQMIQQYGVLASTRSLSDAALAASQKETAELEAQATMLQTVAMYGADSASVSYERLLAEQAVYEAYVSQLDVSSAVKDQLLEAWAAANGLESAGIAAMIEAALGPAGALASLLQNAAAAWNAVSSLSPALGQVGTGTKRAANGVMGALGSWGKWGQDIAGRSLKVWEKSYGKGLPDGVSATDFMKPSYYTGDGKKGGGGGKSDAEKLHNDRLKEAKKLYEETRTEAEKYAAALADLDEMHRSGYIDADTYARAVKKLKEEYGGLEGYAKKAAEAIRSAFDGVFEDAQGALEDLAKQLAMMALYQGLGQMMPSVFGKSGIIPLVGGRANGGNVRAGAAYEVGEQGRELFVPQTAGRIMPNSAMQGGGSGTVVQVIDMRSGGQAVETQTSNGPDGKELIILTVKDATAQGRMDSANKARYGQNTQTRRR